MDWVLRLFIHQNESFTNRGKRLGHATDDAFVVIDTFKNENSNSINKVSTLSIIHKFENNIKHAWTFLSNLFNDIFIGKLR